MNAISDATWMNAAISGFKMPTAARPRSPREARMASAAKPTFGQCAEALLAAKSSEWRNARHRAQWRMTLETYAGPRAESYCRAGSRICDPDGGSLWRSAWRALG